MLVYILLAIIVLGALYVVVTYNSLVSLRTRASEAWSDIQVQMKRRYDLIPNLVETVKGYATHEAGTLEAVVEARNRAMADSGSPAHQAESENMLQHALKNLFALVENYPDLKANTNFLELQREISDIENKIAAARRFFNNSVQEYNTSIMQIPGNFVAPLGGFHKRDFFEIPESSRAEAEKAPEVKF